MPEAKAEWFGPRLKELRERAQLTQEQLASLAGLTREGVAQLEIGRRQPAWGTVLSLCRALGVGCDCFLDRPGESPVNRFTHPLTEQPQPRREQMTLHLARLCWNAHGWSRPSGLAPHAEGPAKGSAGTFVSEHGYGHEEWLFRPEHAIDGWRYGFLQPALKATAWLGKELNVVLYTKDPEDERWYLGRIDGLVVLDDEDAKKARDQFAHRKWLDSMRADLLNLNLSAATLGAQTSAREVVNVKYRPGCVHMLPERLRASSDDTTRKTGKNRYKFYQLDGLPACLARTRADPARPTDEYSYRTAPIVHADRRHNRLQELLAELLRGKYGQDAVELEVDGVDVWLRRTDGVVFIELKSEPDARLAIREALGQLLEYALFPRTTSSELSEMPELVVVAPGDPDSAVEEYVRRLRTRCRLPIRYVAFNEQTTECPL